MSFDSRFGLLIVTPRMTSLDADGCVLDDGEVAHEKTPDIYWIPDEFVPRSLPTGQFAKLRSCFRREDEPGQVSDNGERVWPEVKGVVGGWYQGEIANQPSCTDEISPGLEVWFEPRHVIDVHS